MPTKVRPWMIIYSMLYFVTCSKSNLGYVYLFN